MMRISESTFNKIAITLPLLGLLAAVISLGVFAIPSSGSDAPYVFLPYLFAYVITILHITAGKEEKPEELLERHYIKFIILFNILSTTINLVGHFWLIYIVEDTSGSAFFKYGWILAIASTVALGVSAGYAIFVKILHHYFYGKNKVKDELKPIGMNNAQKRLILSALALPLIFLVGINIVSLLYKLIITRDFNDQFNSILGNNFSIYLFTSLASFYIYTFKFKKTSLIEIAEKPTKFSKAYILFYCIFSAIVIPLITFGALLLKLPQISKTMLSSELALGIPIFLMAFIAQGAFAITVTAAVGYCILYVYSMILKSLYNKLGG